MPGPGTASMMPAGSTSSTCATGSQSSGVKSGVTPVNDAGAMPTIGVGLAAKLQGAADDVFRLRELAHPHAMRQHDHALRAGVVVGGLKQAAAFGLHAKHLKVIRRDDLSEHEARSFAETERREHRRVADHVGEDGVAGLEILKVRKRVGGVHVAVAAGREHVDERVGIGDWQRPEQQRVHEREHRRVGADAEAERQHGDGGEARTPPQPSERVADVGQEHGSPSNRVFAGHKAPGQRATRAPGQSYDATRDSRNPDRCSCSRRPAVAPGTRTVHQHDAAPGPGWTWASSARVYFGANLQERKFTDFYYVESQNWFMAEGGHRAGAGRFMLHTMISLEPVTLRRLGSAQVFQTGETLDGAPLIDYQHPHDFFMAIEARYERPVGERGRVWLSAAPVGAIALGPTPFMHRASADHNPTAPLAHHNLDSTHITRSVVSAGAAHGAFSVEASVFKGLEPDENRWDLDLGVPDSWSARVAWTRGPWHAQFSGGHLTTPDAVEPFVDVVQLTSSLEYTGSVRSRPLAVTFAVGRNREVYGNLDAALVEATWRPSSRWVTYARGEVVEKNILTAGGLHPPGFHSPAHFLDRRRVHGRPRARRSRHTRRTLLCRPGLHRALGGSQPVG